MQNQTLDIQLCVSALWELQHNTSNCPLNAVLEKYTHQKVCGHIMPFEFLAHLIMRSSSVLLDNGK
jgi:hypothetical protein